MNKTSLQRILTHFGTMSQILKLVEEMSELTRAIMLAIANHGLNPDAILADKEVQTEITDVIILLKQLGMIAVVSEAVTVEAPVKLYRTIKRIENGYYEGGGEE